MGVYNDFKIPHTGIYVKVDNHVNPLPNNVLWICDTLYIYAHHAKIRRLFIQATPLNMFDILCQDTVLD